MCLTKSNLQSLLLLCKSKKKLRKAIIVNADNKFILAICECILNFLKGKVKIDVHRMKKVKKYQNQLRELVKQNVPIKRKRDILEQKGSGIWMSLLLPPILEVAQKLFTSS